MNKLFCVWMHNNKSDCFKKNVLFDKLNILTSQKVLKMIF